MLGFCVGTGYYTHFTHVKTVYMSELQNFLTLQQNTTGIAQVKLLPCISATKLVFSEFRITGETPLDEFK